MGSGFPQLGFPRLLAISVMPCLLGYEECLHLLHLGFGFLTAAFGFNSDEILLKKGPFDSLMWGTKHLAKTIYYRPFWRAVQAFSPLGLISPQPGKPLKIHKKGLFLLRISRSTTPDLAYSPLPRHATSRSQ